jgi:hypothetical protein
MVLYISGRGLIAGIIEEKKKTLFLIGTYILQRRRCEGYNPNNGRLTLGTVQPLRQVSVLTTISTTSLSHLVK